MQMLEAETWSWLSRMIMRFNWCVLKRMTLKLLKVFSGIFESHDVSLCWQLSGGCELTVVLHDFSAGCSTELSVCTGEENQKKSTPLMHLLFSFYDGVSNSLPCKPIPERHTALSAGQTVELLERPSERPGWCLVRTTERTPPQEGLVPSSVLCVSHSRSSVEMDCFFSSGKGRKDKPEVQINSGFFFLFFFFFAE